ncbi:MAG: flagellar basal body rod protein FlgB [Syntrophomonadaceae bacterium]|nr:flagellar basal body rod protein FlgB [Syntrophomonadaceae bacterium]
MLDILSSPVIQGMEKALDGSVLRQKAIAANIANVDTPGYKSIEVSFAEQLRDALKKPGEVIRLRTTDKRHIQINNTSAVQGFVISQEDTQVRNDGNNVDIDREIVKLTSNELYYDAISRCLNNEFDLLRKVIQGRV